METVLKVEGMSCGHCKSAVEGAVSELTGVDSVEVSLEEALVKVKHSDSITVEMLKETIEDQGYDVL